MYIRCCKNPSRLSDSAKPQFLVCPSALSADLDNLAPRGPLRGTRPSRVRKGEANTHPENDPAAPKPRLSRRTADCSTQPSMRPGAGGAIFDPAGHPLQNHRRSQPGLVVAFHMQLGKGCLLVPSTHTSKQPWDRPAKLAVPVDSLRSLRPSATRLLHPRVSADRLV
jgi:hypothetical protein